MLGLPRTIPGDMRSQANGGKWLGLPAQGLVLALVLIAACGFGAFPIAPAQTLAILLDRLGVIVPVAFSPQQQAVLLTIRLPQVVLAALVGASLGVSGTVVQGMFRNPLADPALVGISGGASLAAAFVIVMGFAARGAYLLPLAAFLGGLVACLGIYRFARRGGRTEVTTLLLAGLAVTAITNALVGLLMYVASDQQVRAIVFWLMGSVSGVTWHGVMLAAPGMLLGMVLLLWRGPTLNVLILGDAPARHLGVETERARVGFIALVALTVSAGVAVAGIVGFVGLVVPHLMRALIGPDHRVLLPASALGGASLVVVADLIARMAIPPALLPLGLVTSLLGAPFFLYLIDKTRREQGGWG